MFKLFDFIKGNKLSLVEKKQEHGDIWSFSFKSEKVIQWKAGQHILVSLDKSGSKMFSVSTAPNEGVFRITTHLGKDTQSKFKKKLSELVIGEKITARGPVGAMSIKNEDEQYVFMTGGIGITPFISIMRQLQLENKLVGITLLYANKDQNILFKSEIDHYAKHNPNFNVKFITSPERINKEMIIQSSFDLLKTNFFVSGPRPMIKEMKEILKETGAKKVKTDPFYGYK